MSKATRTEIKLALVAAMVELGIETALDAADRAGVLACIAADDIINAAELAALAGAVDR